MHREQLDTMLADIRAVRVQVLADMDNLTEAEFGLPIESRPWKWDTVIRALLQFGNHMREHATHIHGTRALLDHPPSQPQRILAEAEIAWGGLLGAVVGLTDDDLDRVPVEGAFSLRDILEHIRSAEYNYLEAIREARATRLTERD